MKIIKQDLDHSLICWSANNYKYQPIYVVAYGLQVKQFDSLAAANTEWSHCLKHSKQCNKAG